MSIAATTNDLQPQVSVRTPICGNVAASNQHCNMFKTFQNHCISLTVSASNLALRFSGFDLRLRGGSAKPRWPLPAWPVAKNIPDI